MTPGDDCPAAWARAVRTLLRRSLRGDRQAPDRSQVLRDASQLLDDYRDHVSVNAETLMHVLAGRIDCRRVRSPQQEAFTSPRRPD